MKFGVLLVLQAIHGIFCVTSTTGTIMNSELIFEILGVFKVMSY